MKLYLSSYGLGNNPQDLVNLAEANKKIAVIDNALDFANVDLERRAKETGGEVAQLRQLGFTPEVLDLKNYFNKSGDLAKKLTEFGALWVRGGNVFILRRAFAQSGLDKWLEGKKTDPDFVYAGYSAGVCVLSPSLKGSDITDDPNREMLDGYNKEVIWDGLNLIDFAFAPHFESDHPESASISKEVEYYTKEKINHKKLHDGEVIIQET